MQTQAIVIQSREQFEAMDFHLARRGGNLLAASGTFVERHALLLQRGIHRRNLRDAAGELRKLRANRLVVERRYFTLARDSTFGIICIRADPELAFCFVSLARAKQVTGNLGRLAEADRQQPGGERIEAAAVASLVRAEQSLRDLQRPV